MAHVPAVQIIMEIIVQHSAKPQLHVMGKETVTKAEHANAKADIMDRVVVHFVMPTRHVAEEEHVMQMERAFVAEIMVELTAHRVHQIIMEGFAMFIVLE